MLAPQAMHDHAFSFVIVNTALAMLAACCHTPSVRINANLAADVSDVSDSELADAEASGWFSDVVSAVSSVASPIVSTVTAPVRAAASGVGSVAKALGPVWDIAATGASFIPGVGTAVSAGMAAASAVGRGESLRDIGLSAARGAVPGGPAAKAAFDVAVGMAKGKRIDRAAVDAARKAVPGGALGRAAFDRGIKAVQAVKRGDLRLAGRAMTDRDVLGEATRAVGAMSGGLLPAGAETVARAILRQPALRKLPVAAIAQKFGVDANVARHAVASIVQAARKGASALAPAPALARNVPADMTVDRALAKVGGQAAPPVLRVSGAPTAGRGLRLRRVDRAGLSWLMRRLPALSKLPAAHLENVTLSKLADARGLDATGTKYLVEKDDWPAKIAKKLTGDAAKWKALISANPQKKVDPKTGNFKTLYAGELLNVPKAWQKPAPGSGGSGAGTPVPPPPAARKPGEVPPPPNTRVPGYVPPKQTPKPNIPIAGDAPPPAKKPAPQAPPKTTTVALPKGAQGITQVQALLAAWAHAYPKWNVYPTFGNEKADFSGIWDFRTGLLMKAFQTWWNQGGKSFSQLGAVPVDGALEQASYDALFAWAQWYAKNNPAPPQIQPGVPPGDAVPPGAAPPGAPPAYSPPAAKSGSDSGAGLAALLALAAYAFA